MQKNLGNRSSGQEILQQNDKKLQDYLSRMKGRTVLVVGDIMLDHFIYGDVSRMSAEAPVPVLLKEREEHVPGGAGNVLANLAGLGVNAAIVAVIGDDVPADTLKEKIKTYGADPDGLVVDKTRPTIVKARFLAKSQHLLRVDSEDASPVSQETEAKLLDKVAARIGSAAVLVLSDYGKGVLTPSLTASLIALAKEKGVPVLVDPKGTDYSKYKGATLVTPNAQELSLATGGAKTDSDDEAVTAAGYLKETAGIDSVLATRSQHGMTLLEQNRPPVHIRATAQEVFDVTGAGDTVIATMAGAIAGGASLAEAAYISNLAAGIVVSKVGTVAIGHKELGATIKKAAAA